MCQQIDEITWIGHLVKKSTPSFENLRSISTLALSSTIIKHLLKIISPKHNIQFQFLIIKGTSTLFLFDKYFNSLQTKKESQ